MSHYSPTLRGVAHPRVVIFGLASCFGCQLQITNNEQHLLDVLSHIELSYWQLVDNAALPDDFDVAIIEGVVCTEDARALVHEIRTRARVVVAMGACALGAGIPGMAGVDAMGAGVGVGAGAASGAAAASSSVGSDASVESTLEAHAHNVYGKKLPRACGKIIAPRALAQVIDVDYEIPCCPINFDAFVQVLHHVLYGSNVVHSTTTMCGECKMQENQCLLEQGVVCMGLVTRAGCKAKCPSLGRACNGCAGISPDANVTSARSVVQQFGLDDNAFMQRLELFNAGALCCVDTLCGADADKECS